MIEFQDVRRSYGSKVAVAQLDLSIANGELFTLLGHNGAGKTTTIKMLVGLLQPQQGRVLVEGYDVVTQTREALQLVGYVPDQPYLYEKLSGREFLQFVGEMHGLSPGLTAERIQREAERFTLHKFLDDLTESYSHGMKQRTVFASALLHDPRVLIVDEPMVGLDPYSIRLVKQLLRQQADAGVSVLMSTHTLDAAEQISDRVGVMSAGRLLFCGTIAELRARYHAESTSLEELLIGLTTSPDVAAAPVAGGGDGG